MTEFSTATVTTRALRTTIVLRLFRTAFHTVDCYITKGINSYLYHTTALLHHHITFLCHYTIVLRHIGRYIIPIDCCVTTATESLLQQLQYIAAQSQHHYIISKPKSIAPLHYHISASYFNVLQALQTHYSNRSHRRTITVIAPLPH